MGSEHTKTVPRVLAFMVATAIPYVVLALCTHYAWTTGGSAAGLFVAIGGALGTAWFTWKFDRDRRRARASQPERSTVPGAPTRS